MFRRMGQPQDTEWYCFAGAEFWRVMPCVSAFAMLNPVKIKEKNGEDFVVIGKGCNFASAFGKKRRAIKAVVRGKRGHWKNCNNRQSSTRERRAAGDSSPKVGAAKFCTRHTKFRFSSTIIRRISRSHRNGSDAKLDMSLSVLIFEKREREDKHQRRVWSWLRMNASDRLNTCKSRGSGG